MGNASWLDQLACFRVGEAGMSTTEKHGRVHGRYHCLPSGLQNPANLVHEKTKVPDMFQNQTADHLVEIPVFEWQCKMQVVGQERNFIRAGFLAGFCKHPVGKIHSGNRRPGFG